MTYNSFRKMEEMDVKWCCDMLVRMSESKAPTLMRLDEFGYSVYHTKVPSSVKCNIVMNTCGNITKQMWDERRVIKRGLVVDSLGMMDLPLHAPSQVKALYYLWYHMIHVIKWSQMKRVKVECDVEEVQRVMHIEPCETPEVKITYYKADTTNHTKFTVIPLLEVTYDMFLWFASNYRKFALVATPILCGEKDLHQFLILSEPLEYASPVDMDQFYHVMRFMNHVEQMILRIGERSDYMNYMRLTTFPHRSDMNVLLNLIPPALYRPESPSFRAPDSHCYHPTDSPSWQP
jgi:hypothetical protein